MNNENIFYLLVIAWVEQLESTSFEVEMLERKDGAEELDQTKEILGHVFKLHVLHCRCSHLKAIFTLCPI